MERLDWALQQADRLAGSGEALPAHTQGADLPAHRRHRRSTDARPAGEAGGVHELGLPLLLVARQQFTLTALLNAGLHTEAHAWSDWLLRAVAGAPEKMRIMYCVDGGRKIKEREIDTLPGWNGAKPVRVGNAAAGQRQLDIYGEVLDSAYLSDRAGIPRTAKGAAIGARLVAHVERIWREPDQGMWESRAAPQHYVYSKVMAWVAADRFLKLDDRHGGCSDARRAELEALRDAIHADVCAKGNRGKSPGNQAVVAAWRTRSGSGGTVMAPGTCRRSPR